MNLRTVVLVSCFVLSSCSSQPTTVSYAEIAQKNEALKVEYKRIQKDIVADCLNGICEVSEQTLAAVTQLINSLQDELKDRVAAYNRLIDAQTHCEYANAKKDEALHYMEQKADKIELISGIKQVLTGALCAGLLIAK